MLLDSMILQYRLRGTYESTRLRRRRDVRPNGAFHPRDLVQAREARRACIVRGQVHDGGSPFQVPQLINLRRVSVLIVACWGALAVDEGK